MYKHPSTNSFLIFYTKFYLFFFTNDKKRCFVFWIIITFLSRSPPSFLSRRSSFVFLLIITLVLLISSRLGCPLFFLVFGFWFSSQKTIFTCQVKTHPSDNFCSFASLLKPLFLTAKIILQLAVFFRKYPLMNVFSSTFFRIGNFWFCKNFSGSFPPSVRSTIWIRSSPESASIQISI